MAVSNPCAQKKVYIFTVAATVVFWFVCLIIGGVFMRQGSRTEDLGRDLNDHHTNNNSLERRTNKTDYAPASWAFSIWFFIYFWQAVFLLYCVLSIFPRFSLRKVPVLAFPFYNLANFGGAAWTVCDHYDLYWPGVLAIAAMPLSLYISMIISVRSIYNRKMCLKLYYVYTYAVHNAWAMYAGWVTVAVLLYVGMSMIHAGPDMDTQVTGTIMLSVLAVELVLFCTLEHTFLEKFFRHIWSHYVSLSVAIIGSIAKNWNPHNHNSILTVGIAGFLVCSLCVKMMRLVNEKCARPDKPDDADVSEEEPVVAADVEKKEMPL